eukprot:Amastigsp_a339439_708.p2 type:complete len:608 gc:universal Amastigsp_a339439_708:1839-16(-)
MPALQVSPTELFKKIGRTFTDDEFDELCFAFGIELDEVTSEAIQQERERGAASATASTEKIYKIDLPANRYDLVCVEGLARALRVFLELGPSPRYEVVTPAHMETVFVEPETAAIRPFVVAAILRGVTFTPENYKSFLDLQEKLHANVCRKRTLVAIGTHDLGTLRGPFRYRALAPEAIRFVPLNQTEAVDGRGLMELYDSEMYKHIRPYLPIIRDSPVYPVIYDAADTVLSLPPIINGQHSRITLATRDVFIECTATDHTKACVVLNQMVAMFSEYAAVPFTVEQVRVVYPDARYPVDPSNQAPVYPQMDELEFTTSVADVNRVVGLNLDAAAVVRLLTKMMLRGELAADGNTIKTWVPPTRADILHACDIVEDVAIAYGFNNVPRTLPTCSTVGRQLPINKFSELLRLELAMCGFTEALTFALCSKADCFARMRRVDDGTKAVVIANPKTADSEIVRTDLVPGLLKTLAENKSRPLPLQLFEVSDIVVKSATTDVGATNVRRLAAVYTDQDTAGFDAIHGILDRVMDVAGVKFQPGTTTPAPGCYSIVEGNDSALFPGIQAAIYMETGRIGVMGVVHPEVLTAFTLTRPVSVLEIDVAQFLLAKE